MQKKTFIAALAAAAAVTAVAAPAVAQPYRGQDRYEQRWDREGAHNLNARKAELERRMDQGVRRGLLTRKEVAELNYTLRQYDRSEAAYRSNGLNPRERAALDNQLNWLEARLEGRLGNSAYARR